MNDELRIPRTRRRPKGLVVGLFLIVLGFAFLADQLGLGRFESLAHHWPVLLVLGTVKLWERGPLHIGAHAMIIVGACFELRHLGHDLSALRPWWPLLVVWIGVLLTLQALRPRPSDSACTHD